jgi:uncharacterized protein YdeI (YjbR/CyaY-like superfamily)
VSDELDAWFENEDRWRDVLAELRSVLRGLGLEEARKWRQPCYMHEGKNIAILGSVKANVALTFMRGAVLDDPEGLLEDIGPNARHGKVMRFTTLEQVRQRRNGIVAMVERAIVAEALGLKVEPPAEDVDVPEELTAGLEADLELKAAFEALTPGRRRAYIMHIAQAKQAPTRTARLAKYRDRILKGKGMHDCVCGASKRLPNCDGSHKHLA